MALRRRDVGLAGLRQMPGDARSGDAAADNDGLAMPGAATVPSRVAASAGAAQTTIRSRGVRWSDSQPLPVISTFSIRRAPSPSSSPKTGGSTAITIPASSV